MSSSRDRIHAATLAVLVALTTGCSGGYLLTMEPPPGPLHYETVQVRPMEPYMHPSPVLGDFEERLRLKVAAGGMKEGADLAIEYRVLFLDGGHRGYRFIWFGLANVGEGILEVEVLYKDAGGKRLARIQAQGTIRGGLLGGSFQTAVREAADRVAQYTLLWFFDGTVAAAPLGTVPPVP